MKYQLVYLNVVAVCLNDLDSVCLNGWAGQGKPSLPGASLKYLFVYLKIRIFKCSYRIYNILTFYLAFHLAFHLEFYHISSALAFYLTSI